MITTDEFIGKIEKCLKSRKELSDSQFSIDKHSNGKTFTMEIISSFFDNKSIKESQEFLWEILDKEFPKQELVKINLFLTTGRKEYAQNIIKESLEVECTENYECSLFVYKICGFNIYLYVGVEKQKNEACSQFLFFSDYEKISLKSCRFYYPSDVLKFMELDEDDKQLYCELFEHAKEQGINEIALILMDWGERLKRQGERDNPFLEVYTNFKIIKASKSCTFEWIGEPLRKEILNNIQLRKLKEDFENRISKIPLRSREK